MTNTADIIISKKEKKCSSWALSISVPTIDKKKILYNIKIIPFSENVLLARYN